MNVTLTLLVDPNRQNRYLVSRRNDSLRVADRRHHRTDVLLEHRRRLIWKWTYAE